MPNEIYVMPGGLYNDNYTEVPLVSATAKIYSITVGLDEIWFIYCGYMVNGDSVARDMSVTLFNENNKSLGKFCSQSAAIAGAKLYFPTSPANPNTLFTGLPIFAKQDWRIQFDWSAGIAGAGGTAGIVALVRRFP